MLKNRIIPCLDVKNGRVVKGINFVDLKDAGDPVEQAKIYSDGDRRSGTGKKEFGNEYSAKDLKDAAKHEKERWGKREFKGGSPLAVGKGGTIVAREGLLNQLQDKFGKNLDKSMLNEEIILDEEE